MKRETREQAINRADQACREANLWRMYALDQARFVRPDAVEAWAYNGYRYRLSLYRFLSACGGYVVTEETDGDSDALVSLRVELFDDLDAHFRSPATRSVAYASESAMCHWRAFEALAQRRRDLLTPPSYANAR